MLTTKISLYLKQLIKTSPAIRKQFEESTYEKQHLHDFVSFDSIDPFNEEEHTVVKGLIHRYKHRVLLLVTVNCAAYCRFCMRRRIVSDIPRGVLKLEDIDAIEAYLREHTEVNEVIFSGGDPLTQPHMLKKMIDRINTIPSINIIRVSTRLPIVDPDQINDDVVNTLAAIQSRPVYLMFHVEHPDELKDDCINALRKLQSVTTMTLSQSVFLKGINDDVNILEKLFSRLIEIGVKPYYMFRCDEVQGIESFSVNPEKEVTIMTELRSRLSGIAYPMYVIDSPHGKGKIPIPLAHWSCDHSQYTDYEGNNVERAK